MTIHNLPLQPTPFIGRTKELAELSTMIVNPDIRLITILGSGGMGKTRLAVQAASKYISHFVDGVYLVPLAPLRSTENVASTIAENIPFEFSGNTNPEDQLSEYIQTKSMLLILDNFEHLIKSALFVSNLVAHAPNVTVIITSRSRLNLRSETIYTLNGLTSSQDMSLESLLKTDAVKLFLATAQRVEANYKITAHDIEPMTQICMLTEGMPLGIELAAAWVRVLSLSEIAMEIQSSLDFLATTAKDMPDRLRSIRAVFERSWDLLTDDERDIFRKLSVFRGGFTRESAKAVVSANLHHLTALMDKSLLKLSNDSKRYEVHELLRQYATEKLNITPQEQFLIHNRHCTYFADFLQSREEGLIRSDKQELEVLQELDNIQDAWRWSVTQERMTEIYKFPLGFQLLYEYLGRQFEGAITFEWAANQLRGETLTGQKGIVYGLILCKQAFFFRRIDRGKEANHLAQKGISILSQLDAGEALAWGYLELSRQSMSVAVDTWDYDEKIRLFKGLEIFENAENQLGMILMFLTLGNIAYDNKDLNRAIHYYNQGLQLSRSNRQDRNVNWALWGLSNCYVEMGSYDIARTYIVEVLDSGKELDSRGSTHLRQLAEVDYAIGDYSKAWDAYCRCLQLDARHPYRAGEKLLSLVRMSRILMKQSRLIPAVEILTMVQTHHVGVKSTGKSADELLGELRTQLIQTEFDSAQHRGKNLQLDDLINQILQDYEDSQAKTKAQDVVPSTLDDLTARELDVLQLMAPGKTNQEIANELIIALGTVKSYTSQIYSKLQVHNRTEAIHRSRELNILS
jgi:predicted ATPase/DNA-binding CsgD family transcriptional regulator